MKRLFIALKTEFSTDSIKFFEQIKKHLSQEKIKWVNFSQMHITLKFLGNTDEVLIDNISLKLEKISKKYPIFTLKFRGLGIFKNFSNPRVLWIGIEKTPILNNLQKEVEKEMALLGFREENRDFKPHLTLGRIKYIKEKKKFVEYILEHSHIEIEAVKFESFYLIESILKKQGPEYIDISKFSFY